MRVDALAVRLDTMRTVETPEGCRIDLRVAGLVARARAWLVDLAIRAFIYLVAVEVLVLFGKVGFGAILLVVFALEWLYPVYFEAAWHGATPGKRVCRLAVLRDDGGPIDWGAAMIRNTLRIVDFLPLLYMAGTICMFLRRDFKRLGDVAAGTIVVYTDEPPRAGAARRRAQASHRRCRSRPTSSAPSSASRCASRGSRENARRSSRRSRRR